MSLSALTINATFGISGVYTLRLTASDGALSTSDDVVITVNQAPLVNAGPDRPVALADALTLQGVASDDGQPTGSTPPKTKTARQ